VSLAVIAIELAHQKIKGARFGYKKNKGGVGNDIKDQS
tara:strand:- start:116 stop:229 length:114 start_codon:yes stop_codon:yes gene_type:complete